FGEVLRHVLHHLLFFSQSEVHLVLPRNRISVGLAASLVAPEAAPLWAGVPLPVYRDKACPQLS
ncbi:MAG: hypothetical protein QF491_12830, partial [Alphaproteobacteria bacterium]|nr:hypothetical protein [Alphaproteobacteria bacterium]